MVVLISVLTKQVIALIEQVSINVRTTFYIAFSSF